MKTRTYILTGLMLFIGFGLFACSCPVYKNLEIFQFAEFEQSECVFIGEVLEFNPDEKSYRIKVVDSFKGTENGLIFEGTYDQQCGPIINGLGKWIFYGHTDSNGILRVNECGLTRSFENPVHGLTDFEKSDSEIKKQAQIDLKSEIKKLREK
jgi:hypothetical protein